MTTAFHSNLRRMAGLLLQASLMLVVAPTFAKVINVTSEQNLQEIIDTADNGDQLLLSSGQYTGNFIIEKTLTLTGPEDRSAQIIGDGTASTILIKAQDVIIEKLTIRGSGLDLPAMDSGIFLDKTAHNAVIRHNDIIENLIGVNVWGPDNVLVLENKVVGNSTLRRNERGNDVQLWDTPGTKIINNKISAGRDGIYVKTSKENLFQGNEFRDVRFAVHYMYTQDSEVSENISHENDIAFALMFSDRLKVKNNISLNSKEHGLALNYVNQSDISGNQVLNGEKCVFIYNANMNDFSHNRFEQCGIGVHFTAGSEQNKMRENAFINNQTQVMYVGTRYLDWSEDGIGNYWSDNTAFDLDGDGIADTAYRPNGIMDQVLWRAPIAKVLLNSPATQVIKWAQSQFPAIHPGGVVDSAPLMKPPAATESRFSR